MTKTTCNTNISSYTKVSIGPVYASSNSAPSINSGFSISATTLNSGTLQPLSGSTGPVEPTGPIGSTGPIGHTGLIGSYRILEKFDDNKNYHNLNGPAIVYDNGQEEYYFHGVHHRIDGPACYRQDFENDYYHEEYYIFSKHHNFYGPGIYSKNKNEITVKWFLDGEEYSFDEWCILTDKSNEEINFLKLKYNITDDVYTHKSINSIFYYDINKFTLVYGKTYFGRPHRIDGPAIFFENESEIYCVRGILHRIAGPAIIDNVKQYHQYYIEGKLHRTDGPAVEYHDGSYLWFLNDVCYSFNDWCIELNKSEKEIDQLKLKWNII